MYWRRFIDLLNFRRTSGFAGPRGLGFLFLTTLPALILGAVFTTPSRHISSIRLTWRSAWRWVARGFCWQNVFSQLGQKRSGQPNVEKCAVDRLFPVLGHVARHVQVRFHDPWRNDYRPGTKDGHRIFVFCGGARHGCRNAVRFLEKFAVSEQNGYSIFRTRIPRLVCFRLVGHKVFHSVSWPPHTSFPSVGTGWRSPPSFSLVLAGATMTPAK